MRIPFPPSECLNNYLLIIKGVLPSVIITLFLVLRSISIYCSVRILSVKPIDLSLTFHSSSEKQKETEGNLSKWDSSESYTFGDQNTIGKKSKRIDENDLTNKKIRLLSINSEQTIPSNSKSSSSNLSVRETRPIHPIKTIFSKLDDDKIKLDEKIVES
jgi:hypothetical protein